MCPADCVSSQVRPRQIQGPPQGALQRWSWLGTLNQIVFQSKTMGSGLPFSVQKGSLDAELSNWLSFVINLHLASLHSGPAGRPVSQHQLKQLPKVLTKHSNGQPPRPRVKAFNQKERQNASRPLPSKQTMPASSVWHGRPYDLTSARNQPFGNKGLEPPASRFAAWRETLPASWHLPNNRSWQQSLEKCNCVCCASLLILGN